MPLPTELSSAYLSVGVSQRILLASVMDCERDERESYLPPDQLTICLCWHVLRSSFSQSLGRSD